MNNLKEDLEFIADNGYIIKNNILETNYCKRCINYLENDFSGNKLNIPQTSIPYFYSNFNEKSIIYKILENDEIHKIIKGVLGPNYKLLWFKIFNKIKWIGQDVEYHQEYIYNKNSKINMNESFQLFLALDNHTIENGCLKILPKMHNNLLKHDEFIDRHGDHKHRVNCDILTDGVNKHGIVDCILNPGDCVFFSDTTPHGSGSNPSPNDRYGVSISFLKGDVNIDTNFREQNYFDRKQKSKIYLETLLKKNVNQSTNTPNIFL